MCVRIVRTEERCASGLYRRQGGKRTPRRSERRPRRAEPLVRLRRAPGCIGSSAHWADRGAYSGCSVSWTGSEACSARCMHWADCRDGQRPMHALGRLSRRTSIKTGRGSVGNRRLGTEGTRRRDGTRRVRLVRKERRGVSSQYGRGGGGGGEGPRARGRDGPCRSSAAAQGESAPSSRPSSAAREGSGSLKRRGERPRRTSRVCLAHTEDVRLVRSEGRGVST